MSASPARVCGIDRAPAGTVAAAEWEQIGRAAPALAVTMRRYLAQAATFLAPRSVAAADGALRQLARWLLASTSIESVAGIRRDDIEDFKVWLSDQDGTNGTLSANTFGQRLRTLRVFFERIIDWDWPDAPPRNPVIGGDIPPRPDPLPRFLDDRDAARLMAAARACADPRDRLVIELLARTGMRAGELADLEADAVVLIGAAHWLRIPLGKLRNDRYVPLHPELVALLAAWTAANLAHIRACRRLAADHRGPLNRYQIGRIVGRVGRSCGVSVHPHQLRHTLATQANRGMRLEAIAALLGHRTMEMTLIYANSRVLHQAGEKPQVSWSVRAPNGSGARWRMPADLGTLGATPAGCMIRPFEGCRPPRGGTLSRGPSSGRAGRPEGCPIASKRTGPLLPPRCGLGIRRVPIPDSASTHR